MEEKKEKSKKAFNDQAQSYDFDIKGKHARVMYPYVLEKLDKSDFNNFLDLGCGTGELIKLVLNTFSDKQAYGLDISEEMLKVADKKLSNNVELVLGDSENLPYATNFFDVVYCNDSFHHYPSPQRVLTEVFRVLKPSGTLIITDCWQPLFGRVIMNMYMKYSKEGDVKIYSEREIKKLLSANFRNISWKKLNTTSSIVTAQK